MSTSARRLRALEAVYHPLAATCETCHGHPARLVYIDPDTDAVWHETMPETGCPDCGAPTHPREHHLIMPKDPAVLRMFRRGDG
jgi:hypothetical protein